MVQQTRQTRNQGNICYYYTSQLSGLSAQIYESSRLYVLNKFQARVNQNSKPRQLSACSSKVYFNPHQWQNILKAPLPGV